MEKIKLGICIGDKEYQARFTRCIMHHYSDSYEVHIIEHLDEDVKKQKNEFHVVITEDENNNLLLLENEQVSHTEKYQEVYKIIEDLEKVLTERRVMSNRKINTLETQIIGVFSLGKEVYQIPFAALLAEILGETSRVLVIDMQPFSGLSREIEVEEVLGLEDLMSVATTENYTSSRLSASIGHEQKWDFVYPVKNVTCLSEACDELYQKMIHILQKEKGYHQIIINFGSIFSGIVDLMEMCHQFYFLTDHNGEPNWREEAFVSEIGNLGRDDFLQRIIWMGVPVDFVKEKSWKQLARTWLWNELGDRLRELSWRES